MLRLALGLCCAAAAIGGGLAVHYARGPQVKQAPVAVPVLHGALGAASLATLLLALRRGLPASADGTAGFGAIAAGLLGLALLLGLVLAHAAWRKRRPAGVLVGGHAGLAIAGLVVLLTLVALGS